jgi:hypothetical protein
VIDFRYHLVSTIAIFMALALGIVVGTTQLNDQVLDNLRSSISSLTSDKRALESQTRQLQGQVGEDDAFVESVAADLVAGDLAGESVLLVTAPGAPGDLSAELAPVLEDAGAQLVGRLQLRSPLLDPSQGRTLDDLATEVRPSAFVLPDGEPVDRAAALLAAALVRNPADTGISDDDAEAVVGGLSGGGFVDLDRERDAPRRATLAVVVVPGAGQAAPTEEELERLRGVLTTARVLDQRSKGAVVVGSLEAAREGGAVEAVRDDPALADEIGSVDTVDRPLGRVLVVKALAQQVRGQSVQLGTGPGAEAAVPSPGPS